MIPEPYNYILAAFGIDFEGSIRFQMKNVQRRTVSFHGRMSIGNTSKLLLEGFKEQVGFGQIRKGAEGTLIAEKTHQWELSVEHMRLHLPKIEPHLILKQEQARLLLRAYTILKTMDYYVHLPVSSRGSMYTVEEFEELLYIHTRMRELNRKPLQRRPELTEAEKLLIQLRGRRL
jgi:hypothetical protein